ncbi:hypothetical protein [Geodermatophilus sp. SYSU D00079]
MSWVVVVGAGWLLIAVTGAVVIGRSIRLAEHREIAAPSARPSVHASRPRAYAGCPRGRRRASTSRAVSACVSRAHRSPSSWENETT